MNERSERNERGGRSPAQGEAQRQGERDGLRGARSGSGGGGQPGQEQRVRDDAVRGEPQGEYVREGRHRIPSDSEFER
jgi:hypothetical protein